MPTRRHMMLGLAMLPVAGCSRATDRDDPAPSVGLATALPPMLSPRATHAAVTVSGGALMIGGFASEGAGLTMVERYDSRHRRFERFATTQVARIQPVAVVLADESVLVIGGEWNAPVSSAELLTRTGEAIAIGPMRDRRTAAAAIALRDGRVLITGGSRPGYRMAVSAELYDPATRSFASIAPMRVARAGHAATLLPDGRVLITGGGEGGKIERSAEIFDPETGSFSSTASMRQARYKHGAIAWGDGSVLVIGGSDDRSGPDGRGRLAGCERYDHTTGTFAPAPNLTNPRYKLQNAAVALPDGTVVVASGAQTAEILRPAAPRFDVLAGFDTRRDFMTATALGPREVLVAGGYDSMISGSNKAWLLRT